MRHESQTWEEKRKLFETSFEELNKDFKVDTPIIQNIIYLISQIEYFAHKCVRYYFFNNNQRFLQDLFKGYQDGVSTFSQLFQENIENHEKKDIILPMIIDRLKPDVDFDGNFVKINEYDNEFTIDEKINYNINDRMRKVSSDLNEVINFLDPILQKIVPVQKHKIQFTQIEFIKTLLAIYNSYNGGNLYKKYLPVIKEGFLKMPELVNNSIQDIEMPDQFKELRKRLVILGYLEFDEAIDRKELFYAKYKAFNKVDRRVLLV
jgi:hypothetical protein